MLAYLVMINQLEFGAEMMKVRTYSLLLFKK
jgi:hypothetical protein